MSTMVKHFSKIIGMLLKDSSYNNGVKGPARQTQHLRDKSGVNPARVLAGVRHRAIEQSEWHCHTTL